jgi:putative ABC transport system permease protein
LKAKAPRRANQIGSFYVELKDAGYAADVSRAIDAVFKNSLAETMTETEKSFQLGFIAQVEAIVLAIQIVSYVVIVIIMAVVANTMAMTARERMAEYATFKALGFSPGFVAVLIFGETLMLTLLGGIFGILLLFPIAKGFGVVVSSVFPVFKVSNDTVVLQLVCALVVGVVAAIVPSWRSARIKIVDGLRHVG